MQSDVRRHRSNLWWRWEEGRQEGGNQSNPNLILTASRVSMHQYVKGNPRFIRLIQTHLPETVKWRVVKLVGLRIPTRSKGYLHLSSNLNSKPLWYSIFNILVTNERFVPTICLLECRISVIKQTLHTFGRFPPTRRLHCRQFIQKKCDCQFWVRESLVLFHHIISLLLIIIG